MHSLWRIIPFIVFGLILIFGLHFLFYRSLVSFFEITKLQVRHFLAASVSVLAVLFLVSLFFAREKEGLASKTLYVFGSGWIAILINLMLAAFLIWIVSLILRAGGFNFSRPWLAGIIFGLALVYSAYGFWNSFNPRIKDISVNLNNLPPDWRGAKVVQLSDVHLGQIYGPAFMERMAAEVNAQDPDLILITGDLFDGMDGDLSRFIGPLKQLKAKKGIYFVTGNHETYLGVSDALRVLNEANIKVLNDQFVSLDGLQIVGISYPTQEEITGASKNTQEIISGLAGFDKNKPSILLHHAPTNVDQAKAAGISFQLSGHTHKGQIFPIDLITWAIYGKYYYGLNIEGDFSIYTTNGQGTWGPPMRTGNRPEIPVFVLR